MEKKVVNFTREQSGRIGENIEFQMLNSRSLTSGAPYQRPLDNSKVAEIASNFDEHRANPIKVSFREGRYWVFDGQHTLAGIKSKNKGEDCMVWCEVHFGLTYQQEAKLFAEQNDGVTKIGLNYKTASLIEAKHPKTLELKNTVESCGFELGLNSGKGDYKIIAIGKLKTIHDNLGKEGLTEVLTLIKNTWEGQSNSLDREILGGVYHFVKTYTNEYKEDIFVRNLKKVNPLVIKRNGKSDTSASGDLKFAKEILKIYNTRLSKKSRLEYKFKG